MSAQDRRTFLKRAAGAVAAGGAFSVVPATGGGQEPVQEAGPRALDVALLGAVASAVLPVEALGADGPDQVVNDFTAWLAGYEPVAELDHPYLTDELRFAPADPAPRWRADLEALDLEARQRAGRGFVELPTAERQAMLRRALDDAAGSFPQPARASHVALGLLAWFYASSQANDLCYQARVGRRRCRGIESLPQEPAPLEDQG